MSATCWPGLEASIANKEGKKGQGQENSPTAVMATPVAVGVAHAAPPSGPAPGTPGAPGGTPNGGGSAGTGGINTGGVTKPVHHKKPVLHAIKNIIHKIEKSICHH
jgi:hypothetical protein